LQSFVKKIFFQTQEQTIVGVAQFAKQFSNFEQFEDSQTGEDLVFVNGALTEDQ